MKRTSVLVVTWLACVAALAAVSNASAGNFDKFRMGCLDEEPAVCPTGMVGHPYSLLIYLDRDSDTDFERGADFDCATYRVSSGAFPPGLSVSDDGFISGTPTEPGRFDFYLTVSYRKTSLCPGKTPSDDRFVINVNPRLTITTAGLPDANLDQAYTAPALTAAGGTVNSWSLVGGALPAGLTLAPNGVVSGTPTQSGQFGFTVQARSSDATETRELSLFVVAPLALQTLTGTTPPQTGLTATALVGQPLATGIKAVGGHGPYTFGADGEVPPGITLDPGTGTITGAGTTAGAYAFTVTITDTAGTKASIPWNITILPRLSFANRRGLPVGHLNRRYSARITLEGKDAATARLRIAGTLPPGLTLAQTGRLTGTPRRPGTYRFRVFASGSGAPISKQFTIRVRA